LLYLAINNLLEKAFTGENMKKLFCAFAILLFGLSVASAKAANVTGIWKATMTAPNGGSQQMTYTFKQNGAVVTGTVQGPQGNLIEISNGKIDGNDFRFDVSFGSMTIHHLCTVNGDEMSLKTKYGDGDQGGTPPSMEMTLKREIDK
jgi:hypothetical protein